MWCYYFLFQVPIRLFYLCLGLGLEKIKDEKKIACPARVAEAGQENIETVHEPEPIQTTDSL